MSAQTQTVDAEFPIKLQFLFQPARYKVAHGGRGSSKSWSVARALLIKAQQKKLRILCTREFQSSITDSVHKLLSDQVTNLGLDSFYTIQQRSIFGLNGSEFIFEGIRHNVNKIKSTEGIDICWVEEAEKVSENSWQVLIPTVRKEESEIWITFNPDLETDPTYKRFVKNKPPDALVQEVNWRDNPFFPKVLEKEKDYDFTVDADAAMHVWEGHCRENTAAAVLHSKWIIDSFTDREMEDAHGPYFGADFGFAVDPSTLIKCWIKDRKLFIEHEAYGHEVELDHMEEFYLDVPGSKSFTIRADCSRPETIAFMARKGFKIVAADKWPGSVEDGIAHLRHYEKIVIHQRCRHTIQEARLWKYKQDKLTGDILPTLLDGNDHSWDAVRYALAPLIRQSHHTGSSGRVVGW